MITGSVDDDEKSSIAFRSGMINKKNKLWHIVWCNRCKCLKWTSTATDWMEQWAIAKDILIVFAKHLNGGKPLCTPLFKNFFSFALLFCLLFLDRCVCVCVLLWSVNVKSQTAMLYSEWLETKSTHHLKTTQDQRKHAA